MTRTLIALIATGALILPAASTAAPTVKAPVVKPPGMRLAPPTACTSANRMDIFIDEDGIMYECQCQMLKASTLCAWQVIGGTDPVNQRIRRKIELGLLPKRFYWNARYRYIRVLR